MSLSRPGLWFWSLALLAYVVAYPDKFKYQDADSNKEINLLDVLKDYEQTDREHQQEPEVEEGEEEYEEVEKPKNEKSSDDWPGFWMPHRPNEPTRPPKILPPPVKPSSTTTPKTVNQEAQHHDNRISMGAKTGCDDGKTNLTVDWDYTLSDLSCFGSKIRPNLGLPARLYCKTIPKDYIAAHACMNEVIEYQDDVPLFGTHRPVWPVYGEYFYLPKQRWLHSLEHGAIVMLYHPCANTLLVDELKDLVKNCLRRHIITPYNMLDEERPLALLSWGCMLSMSHVHKPDVIDFITRNALNGPEGYIHQDGQFNDQLIAQAATLSDLKDSQLCPKET